MLVTYFWKVRMNFYKYSVPRVITRGSFAGAIKVEILHMRRAQQNHKCDLEEQKMGTTRKSHLPVFPGFHILGYKGSESVYIQMRNFVGPQPSSIIPW